MQSWWIRIGLFSTVKPDGRSTARNLRDRSGGMALLFLIRGTVIKMPQDRGKAFIRGIYLHTSEARFTMPLRRRNGQLHGLLSSYFSPQNRKARYVPNLSILVDLPVDYAYYKVFNICSKSEINHGTFICFNFNTMTTTIIHLQWYPVGGEPPPPPVVPRSGLGACV